MREERKFTALENFGFGPNVMKKVKVCPECGYMTEVTASYCPECGKHIPATLYERYRQQHRCCGSCGEVLAQDAQYCPACGSAVMRIGNGQKGGV